MQIEEGEERQYLTDVLKRQESDVSGRNSGAVSARGSTALTGLTYTEIAALI